MTRSSSIRRLFVQRLSSRKNICVLVLTSALALGVASTVVASTVVASPAANFSNGLLDAGLPIGAPSNPFAVDINNDNFNASINNGVPETAPISTSKLGSLGALAFEPLAPPTALSTPNANAAFFNGSSFGFSQDAVVRGSVDLPTLNALQFWGNGYLGAGTIRPKNFSGKLRENASGATLGVNLPFGSLGTLSGYYNYHRNRVDYTRNRVQQKDNSFGIGAYLSAGGFYCALLGAYGDDAYKARNLDGLYSTTTFDGWQSSGYVETGYEMRTLGLFVLKPFMSYQYSYLEHDTFNPYNLSKIGGKTNYDACYTTLGSRIDINLGGLDSFTLQARSAWVSQLRSKNESIQNYCFGRIPGTIAPSQPYFVGSGAGSDFFWGGAGLRLSLYGNFSVAVDYDCLVNKYQTLHLGSCGILFGF